MAELVACDGNLFFTATSVDCNGTWIFIDTADFQPAGEPGSEIGGTVSLAELPLADSALLMGAALVVFALAYGVRVIRRMMGF